MGRRSFDPDWRVPPGATIEAIMSERGLSRSWLRETFGAATADGLLDGTAKIDQPLAIKLALELGSTPQFWTARETEYRRPLSLRWRIRRLLRSA
jgi:HTH-type transcriptional regulator / antitoxin HigA